MNPVITLPIVLNTFASIVNPSIPAMNATNTSGDDVAVDHFWKIDIDGSFEPFSSLDTSDWLMNSWKASSAWLNPFRSRHAFKIDP